MTDPLDEGSSARRPFDLVVAFEGLEQQLLTALRTGGAVSGHSGVQGDGTETHWRSMFESFLPARYRVSSAFVVDSRGRQSQQIDLAIVDRHFSPLFWEWGGHQYVPAESVYAVFEIKPELNREYVLYAGEKIASVRSLHRTSVPFGWAMGTMPPRDPPPILGGILANESGWSPTFGAPFRKALEDVVTSGSIDLGCVLGQGSFEVTVETNKDSPLISAPDVALVSHALSLLKRLQGMGSAPAIDYDSYASWINP